ncbi:MAG TPA: GIY-YIG nuclease family protein [Candidatus Acidoferrales bacterium]|jgi:putative endonuclease|nr:GIY-YIG nuclease family protein [Candidatus Acidoferrales bacterium]
MYILRSASTGRYYVGSSNDLKRRVSEHVRSHSLATRGRGPWKLVYEEPFDTLLEARRREFEIKRWKSAKLIAELVYTRTR